MFLRVEADDKGGNVDDLPSNSVFISETVQDN